MIAVDCSASMGYASEGNITKFQYATYLAAALSYLVMKQKDAVGLSLYDTEVKTYLPSRAKMSYIRELITALDTATPANQTGTSQALDKLAERISRRSFVVIISDFFDEPESIYSALKHFRHQKHDVLVVQLLDPKEMDFSFGWAATFKDVETGEELITQPLQIQQAYKKAVKTHIESLKRECHNANIDYLLVNTADSFDKVLMEYLAKRRMLG